MPTKPPLIFVFFLALFAAYFGPFFLHSVRLSFFAPFLALAYNRTSFVIALWIAFGAGICLDLVSTCERFGIYGLNFVLTTALLFPQRRRFFEDKASSFALYSAIVAAVSTLIQLALLYVFDSGVVLSGKLFLFDVLALYALDGLYAFLWFTCPMRLYTYIQKVGFKALFKSRMKDESN